MMSRKFAGNILLLLVLLLLIGIVLVFNAQAVAAQDGEPLPAVTLAPQTDWGAVVIIISVVGGVFGVLYKAVTETAHGVPIHQVDANTAERIRRENADREKMLALERAYQEASAAHRLTINTATGLLKLLTPLLTNFDTDDAILEWLDNVQTPGEPPTTSRVEGHG